jgi:F-type H+-transporting ATPase subunit delta
LAVTSGITSELAERYATALFDLARDRGELDRVGADLEALRAMIGESADLRRLIRSPVLTREEQGKAVEALAERAGFADLTRRFVGVVAEHRRLFALPAVIDAFRAVVAEHRGEVTAEVTSAVPLTEEQLGAVREALGRYVGRAVNLVTNVDPSLLGGLVVRVGSRMVDASLRRRLQQLEHVMKGVA